MEKLNKDVQPHEAIQGTARDNSKQRGPYKVPTRTSTSVRRNTSVEGETIEQQIQRLINDGAPVDNEKIPIYTKPSDNVVYGTDVRNDRFENAIEVNEKINKDIDRIRALKVVKKDDEESTEKPNETSEAGEKTGD